MRLTFISYEWLTIYSLGLILLTLTQSLNAQNSTNPISGPSSPILRGYFIMGTCTVAFLITALAILTAVICCYKPKKKEIDLAKPLILSDELKKNSSADGSSSDDESGDVPKLQGGLSEGVVPVIQPSSMDLDSKGGTAASPSRQDDHEVEVEKSSEEEDSDEDGDEHGSTTGSAEE